MDRLRLCPHNPRSYKPSSILSLRQACQAQQTVVLMTPETNPIAHARPRPWVAALMRFFGWRFELPSPPAPKVLILVYPHTSNWDFFWGMMAKWSADWPMRWMAKHTLFIGPIGSLLRYWGGIAVNRKAAAGFVEATKAQIDTLDTLLLVITPEGTRRYVDHWKSGFIRIASACDMPVALGYVDYKRRVVGISEYMRLTGDDDADMAHIAAAYAGIGAHTPDNAGAIRLKKSAR